jgi:hypothetical protein
VSLRCPFGDRARPTDSAPLFKAPLFRLDGILRRVRTQILYKVDRRGAVAARIRRESLKMPDAVLGIDVSKNTFDASLGAGANRMD